MEDSDTWWIFTFPETNILAPENGWDWKMIRLSFGAWLPSRCELFKLDWNHQIGPVGHPFLEELGVSKTLVWKEEVGKGCL